MKHFHNLSHSVPDNLDEQTLAVQEADSFVAMLHDYCGMGAAMRHVMTSALVNPQVKNQVTFD